MNKTPVILVMSLAMGAMSMTAAGQTVIASAPDNTPVAAPAIASKDAAVADANNTLDARVESAMKKHYKLASFNISVIARAGIVHLSGEVPSGVLIDQAESVVSEVQGVREVDNQLRVSGSLEIAGPVGQPRATPVRRTL